MGMSGGQDIRASYAGGWKAQVFIKAGGKHKSSLQKMKDVQHMSDEALIEICLSWKVAHTFSLLIFLSMSILGLGVAFLPASISYLIGTNLFGTLAHKMGR